ncbi:hypothetical protein TNCT_735821 [Trichonephila clavata]|uniref:Uncharacterized protein n=1 Tax=Trichonephila clavata TaxID=2740835 RepID=A0A8X6LRP5_TRICU|nr:hypothetical protein TNCT_735821 [Trichonephila clavata]
MSTLLKGCLPSFIDIFGYVSFIEMVKIGILLSFNGLYQHGGFSFPDLKKQRSSVPVVHSLMLFKICQALDIEVKLAPEEARTTWNAKFNKQLKQKPNVPEVKSKMIYEICNALSLEVELSATTEGIEELNPKPIPKKKPLPIVHSITVHGICQALGLETELNPAAELKKFKLPKKMKNKIIPVVQSEVIFKFCEGLNIRAKLANPQHDL